MHHLKLMLPLALDIVGPRLKRPNPDRSSSRESRKCPWAGCQSTYPLPSPTGNSVHAYRK